mmetsp:Transcript_15114/g.22672  ORF Transcript_15114/g.22672 Transcript_15114/m.22672 type:complete len:243 (-) Transcript_15114:147-875(-)
MRSTSFKTLLAAFIAAPAAKFATLAFSTPSIISSSSNSITNTARIHNSRPTQLPPHQMTLADMSDIYANFPLQSAIVTCGVKASVADGIAQARSEADKLELRRTLAYVLYGGIFIGGFCHFEYDYIFPYLFGDDHSIKTIFEEVCFDNFISAPLCWLPPAYLVKAAVYDYPLREGLEKYVHDIKHNGLLTKYLSIWIPAQSISFSVVPEHLRIVFMASVSFFWFILFSTVASASDANESESN